MGTYHLIDGAKVCVFYRGNRKTCGRCHKLANDCPGEAIAKNCAAGGGERVFLSDHMKKLWSMINFVPTSFSLDDSDKCDDDAQQAQQDATTATIIKFPPSVKAQEPSSRDIELSDGILIKNFAKILDDKELVTFLVNHGLPLDHENEKIQINRGERNSSVSINGLSSLDVELLFKSIHFHTTEQKFFDVPLFCNPLRNMTPIKNIESKNAENTKEPEPEEVETPSKPIAPPNDPSKPKIPGLPEEDMLKKKKKKKTSCG
jgi:hypothetical protein